MKKKSLWLVISLMLIAAFAITACQPATEEIGGYQIPAIKEGKYNVAFVYVGPHEDGGWSQAHDVGRVYVEENLDDVHTAYVEIVAEGADSEQVTRSLARKGFDVIFTTSFGCICHCS